jgi:hypothetical protein
MRLRVDAQRFEIMSSIVGEELTGDRKILGADFSLCEAIAK